MRARVCLHVFVCMCVRACVCERERERERESMRTHVHLSACVRERERERERERDRQTDRQTETERERERERNRTPEQLSEFIVSFSPQSFSPCLSPLSLWLWKVKCIRRKGVIVHLPSTLSSPFPLVRNPRKLLETGAR